MFYSYPQIVLHEVPGEITLALSISGCPLRCKGCHSSETYSGTFGEELTKDKFIQLLVKYKHISCVLFYGGEWSPDDLVDLLNITKENGLKTCLYSGFSLEEIDKNIIKELDYLKVNPYKQELGGLNKKSTNQRFFDVKDGMRDITSLFYNN